MTKKRLQVARPQDQKLGRPTIMDRGLAQLHGSPYVLLAAFAIDLDRVSALDPDDPALPFGWDVWLLERYLEQERSGQNEAYVQLLEDACLAVMELPRARPEEPAVLGAQLPFAIYAGVARGSLPNSLGECFRSWKKPPRDLLDTLAELDRVEGLKARLARHCLAAPTEPALIQPVRTTLEGWL